MTDPISDERLAEIRACENATRPGPWALRDALEGDGFPGNLWTVATDESTEEGYEVVVSVGDRAVGAFIEMARTAIPDLLAYVDELRRELDEATDLDRSALKHQELRDERNRAVAMWHDQKKRADVTLAERDQACGIARGADREWSIRYRDTNGETWVSDLRFTEAGARHEATLEFDSTIEHVEAVYRRLGTWTGADAEQPDWLTEGAS